MRATLLVATAVIALVCLASQPTRVSAKTFPVFTDKADGKQIPPEEPLDIAKERLDTEGQAKVATDESKGVKHDKPAAASKGAIGPTKNPAFVEAEAQAEARYRAPDGWAAARNLHVLRNHAVDARFAAALPGACADPCPAVGGVAGADSCSSLDGWCYYYAAEGRHRRLVVAVGRPTRGGGEDTTEFESDYVRTVGWGHIWDHAGHIRANSLGGSRHPYNVFPQGAVSNTMGRWRQAERAVERIVAGSDACRDGTVVAIGFDYANDDATRPTGGRYHVVVEADGCHLARGHWWADFLNSECGQALE